MLGATAKHGPGIAKVFPFAYTKARTKLDTW